MSAVASHWTHSIVLLFRCVGGVSLTREGFVLESSLYRIQLKRMAPKKTSKPLSHKDKAEAYAASRQTASVSSQSLTADELQEQYTGFGFRCYIIVFPPTANCSHCLSFSSAFGPHGILMFSSVSRHAEFLLDQGWCPMVPSWGHW